MALVSCPRYTVPNSGPASVTFEDVHVDSALQYVESIVKEIKGVFAAARYSLEEGGLRETMASRIVAHSVSLALANMVVMFTYVSLSQSVPRRVEALFDVVSDPYDSEDEDGAGDIDVTGSFDSWWPYVFSEHGTAALVHICELPPPGMSEDPKAKRKWLSAVRNATFAMSRLAYHSTSRGGLVQGNVLRPLSALLEYGDIDVLLYAVAVVEGLCSGEAPNPSALHLSRLELAADSASINRNMARDSDSTALDVYQLGYITSQVVMSGILKSLIEIIRSAPLSCHLLSRSS